MLLRVQSLLLSLHQLCVHLFVIHKEFLYHSYQAVLIVDDEEALWDLATELLNQKGYRTFQATNGEQALRILESESIDLLLTDIIMPEMDGYQLAVNYYNNYFLLE